MQRPQNATAQPIYESNIEGKITKKTGLKSAFYEDDQYRCTLDNYHQQQGRTK
jgi:hypothetical protein